MIDILMVVFLVISLVGGFGMGYGYATKSFLKSAAGKKSLKKVISRLPVEDLDPITPVQQRLIRRLEGKEGGVSNHGETEY